MIIGLIVGGVLVGQELIKAATVRSQITQLQQVETAINTFRAKYNALPGDMPNATAMFGATDANGYVVANGDGDGMILAGLTPYYGGNCLAGAGTQFAFGSVPNEVEEVFHHLNLAGMGNYNIAPPAQYAGTNLTNLPNAVLGGGMLVTCLTSANGGTVPLFQTGTGIAIGGNQGGYYSTRIQYILGTTAAQGALLTITPDLAYALDAKIDDGLPQTGSVGVFLTCSGGAAMTYSGVFSLYAPPTYGSLITSKCNVSMVKMLWRTN